MSAATLLTGPEPRFASMADLLAAHRPVQPVYAIYAAACRRNASAFLQGFPGRVLYAVKANDHPLVLRELAAAGVRDFDCASLPEIAAVTANCPGARCYYMIPVRPRGAAQAAFERFGVRHFMLDDAQGLAQLAGELPLEQCVVFVRMAVHHASAAQDLSSKFGAPPVQVPALLNAVRASGAEAALAFNVGSSVLEPDAYRHGLAVACEVLDRVGFSLRLLDIGGGYPRSYPGYPAPDLSRYFAAVRDAARQLPLPEQGELLCEPGRALAAPGMSALVEVLLRKGNDRLYINDGMYGVFWELRFGMQDRFPARAWRDARPLSGPLQAFCLYGPTCDSTDVLPGKVLLPADIRSGDYLEFGEIGAYSLAGRTNFNGHYSDQVVLIDGPGASPPQA